MKKYFTLFCTFLLLSASACFAQATDTLENNPGMAVGMRSNGKIYVVVAVILTILLGLFLYLANLDKKITKMEKELKFSSGK